MPTAERTRRPRRLALSLPSLGLAAIVAAPIVAILLEFAGSPVREIGLADRALLELRTMEAARGELLLGAYSRYGWSHPGPLPFYLAAPAYLLGGRTSTSLHVFAGVWSALALVAAAATWFRATRRPALRWSFVLATGLVAISVCVGYSVPAFTEIWNPALALLPLFALLVVSATTIAGRHQWLPGAVFLHAVVCQTHAASALVATAALGVSAAAVWKSRASPSPVSAAQATKLSVVVGLACWAPVLLEALIHEGGGNLGHIIRWVGSAGAAPDPARWATAAGALFWPTASILEAFGWERHSSLVGYLIVTGTALGITLSHLREPRHPLLRALVYLVDTLLLSSILAVALLRGPAHVYLFLWLIPVSGLVCLTFACVLAERVAPRLGCPRAAGVAALLCALSMGAFATHHEFTSRPGGAPAEVQSAASTAACHLRSAEVREVRLRFEGPDAWREGAGVALGLIREGLLPVLERGERYRFGDAVTYEDPNAADPLPTLRVTSGPSCEALAIAHMGGRCLTLHPRVSAACAP